MRQSVRRWRLHRRNDLELEDIATWVRPVLTGWVRYYGRFYPSKLRGELRTIDEFIVRWAVSQIQTVPGPRDGELEMVACAQTPQSPPVRPLELWNLRLDDGSRMNREVHVRFCESVGLRCPALLTYLKAYESVAEARQGIAVLLSVLQYRRLHQALGLPHPAPGLREAAPLASSARGKNAGACPTRSAQ